MKSFSLQIIKPKCYFTNYKCEKEVLSFEFIKNNLSIVALGGVNEIGKICMLSNMKMILSSLIVHLNFQMKVY